MKKLTYIFITAISLGLVACGGGEDNTESNGGGNDGETTTSNLDTTYAEISTIKDVSIPEDFNIKISVPKPNHTGGFLPMITQKDDLIWEIKAGKKFHIIIEDYGDIAYGVADEKKKHAADDVFDYEYLVDEPNALMFKRVLPDAAGEGVKDQHHIFVQKEVNGVNYIIRSNGMSHFYKPSAEKMLNAAKSIGE